MNDPYWLGPARIESNIDELHKNQSSIFEEPTERDRSMDAKTHKTKQTTKSKKETKSQKKAGGKNDKKGKKNVSFGEELQNVIYVEKYTMDDKPPPKFCKCGIF